MRTQSMMFVALLATGPALAASNHSNYGVVDGYDYMQGTDIYHQNYDYGLHYDQLTSLPETDSNPYDIPGGDGPGKTGGSSVKLKAMPKQTGAGNGTAGGKAGSDRFPNMDAELQRFQAQDLTTGAGSLSAGSYEALNQSLRDTLQSQGGGGDQSGPGGLPDPYSDLNLEKDLHKDLNKLKNR